jgi:hypothetical protein
MCSLVTSKYKGGVSFEYRLEKKEKVSAVTEDKTHRRKKEQNSKPDSKFLP